MPWTGTGRRATPAERASIRDALEKEKGNRQKAAKLLGISKTTLWRKMKEYGIGDGCGEE